MSQWTAVSPSGNVPVAWSQLTASTPLVVGSVAVTSIVAGPPEASTAATVWSPLPDQLTLPVVVVAPEPAVTRSATSTAIPAASRFMAAPSR